MGIEFTGIEFTDVDKVVEKIAAEQEATLAADQLYGAGAGTDASSSFALRGAGADQGTRRRRSSEESQVGSPDRKMTPGELSTMSSEDAATDRRGRRWTAS